MGKKIESVNMVEGVPSEIGLPGGFKVPLHEGTHEPLMSLAAALGFTSAKGLVYVITYGLTQSLNDSIAGMGKKLDTEIVSEEQANALGMSPGEPRWNDAEKASALHDRMNERFRDILSGDITTRSSGPRLKGLDRIVAEVAWEMIVGVATAKGRASVLPKKASEMAAMVEKLLATGHGDAVREEAQRRFSSQKPSVAFDLADIGM